MAAGSVTVAALQHRPRQAVLVVVLSAVVTAAAALGPLYARAVEQSVLRNVVAEASPAQQHPGRRRRRPTSRPRRAGWPGPSAARSRRSSGRRSAAPRRRSGSRSPDGDDGPGPADQPGRPVRAPDRVRRPLPARRRARCWSAAGRRPTTGLAPGATVTLVGRRPGRRRGPPAGHRRRALRRRRRLRRRTGPVGPSRRPPPEPTPGTQSPRTDRRASSPAGRPWRPSPGRACAPTSTSPLRADRLDLDRLAEVQAATAEVDARAAHRRRLRPPARSGRCSTRPRSSATRPAPSSRCSPSSSRCWASWCWPSSARPPPSSAGRRSRWPGCAGTAPSAPPSCCCASWASWCWPGRSSAPRSAGWSPWARPRCGWQPGVGVEARWPLSAARSSPRWSPACSRSSPPPPPPCASR